MSDHSLRKCFREPIPEINQAAELLKLAVVAHFDQRYADAKELIHQSNMKEIWEWTDSIWGKASVHTQNRIVPNAPPILPLELRIPVRMPTSQEKKSIHIRDGYHCRFCDIPVIRSSIRKKLLVVYPEVIPWGRTNRSQHAAFQAMWAQYDHVLPHSRGGDNSFENVLLTCSACNFGRTSYTLEEVGLADPRLRMPFRSGWNGLEDFNQVKTYYI